MLAAAAELGLRVPADVSVTGFDGADLHWLAPTLLTTVVQPSEAKGRAAAAAAMALVAGEPAPDVFLPVRCGSARRAARPPREPVSGDRPGRCPR